MHSDGDSSDENSGFIMVPHHFSDTDSDIEILDIQTAESLTFEARTVERNQIDRALPEVAVDHNYSATTEEVEIDVDVVTSQDPSAIADGKEKNPKECTPLLDRFNEYKPSVFFDDVRSVYSARSPFTAKLRFSAGFQHNHLDTVMMLPVGWKSIDEAMNSSLVVDGVAKFAVDQIPKASNDLYHLCYVTLGSGGKNVPGVSDPFMFLEPGDESIGHMPTKTQSMWESEIEGKEPSKPEEDRVPPFGSYRKSLIFPPSGSFGRIARTPKPKPVTPPVPEPKMEEEKPIKVEVLEKATAEEIGEQANAAIASSLKPKEAKKVKQAEKECPRPQCNSTDREDKKRLYREKILRRMTAEETHKRIDETTNALRLHKMGLEVVQKSNPEVGVEVGLQRLNLADPATEDKKPMEEDAKTVFEKIMKEIQEQMRMLIGRAQPEAEERNLEELKENIIRAIEWSKPERVERDLNELLTVLQILREHTLLLRKIPTDLKMATSGGKVESEREALERSWKEQAKALDEKQREHAAERESLKSQIANLQTQLTSSERFVEYMIGLKDERMEKMSPRQQNVHVRIYDQMKARYEQSRPTYVEPQGPAAGYDSATEAFYKAKIVQMKRSNEEALSLLKDQHVMEVTTLHRSFAQQLAAKEKSHMDTVQEYAESLVHERYRNDMLQKRLKKMQEDYESQLKSCAKEYAKLVLSKNGDKKHALINGSTNAAASSSNDGYLSDFRARWRNMKPKSKKENL